MKVHDFTVELVRADTKGAFKEWVARDGKAYAEVEPGVDYYINVGTAVGQVRATASVDGVRLGYYHTYAKPNSDGDYLGSWERKDGVSSMTALHFSSPGARSGGHAPSMLTGKVEVMFHKLGEKTYEAARDYAPPELLGNPDAVGGKKCVRSTKGKHALNIGKRSETVPRFKKGEHLCTITLHYCTAAGLVLNRILDAPPVERGTNDENAQSSMMKQETSKTHRSTMVRGKKGTHTRIKEEEEDDGCDRKKVRVAMKPLN